MKLLSAQQIHEWDAYTIEHEAVASIELMERAAGKCADFIIDKNLLQNSFKIFCGKGNNGGDGLAIARQLINAGSSVTVYILEFGARGTDDFQINLSRLHELTTSIHFLQSSEFFPAIDKNDIVIDALFGSGLNRQLKDLSADIVNYINQFDALTISIDVPSGMFIDKSSKNNPVVKSNYTLTFQSLKLCFLVAENAEYFGEVKVLDIGLHSEFLDTIQSSFQLISSSAIRQIYQPRKLFAHKGNFGHALLVAGNKRKTGAAILAAKACLRSGAGLVTLNIPEPFLNAVHAAIPEAMCQLREHEIQLSNISALGIGPGIGTEESSAKLLSHILENFKKPTVLDADALNIISQHTGWLQKINSSSIITPHPKEFERLFGKSNDDFERIELVIELSKKYSFVIVLKGHHTLIAANGEGWFNTTGNAGMAKGGTGDVLTGILTALLAQGYAATQAALLGVYLHGLAADIALQQQSPETMLASDIIENLGGAFYELINR
ncbi:MAG: NAD(P)H-hydrate dehydratase [Parafilimonas sp.]